jgi:hemerythrin-like domain-containing protein
MDEHRVIERVLDAVERMLERDSIDKPFFLAALDFFRNFADGCHHAKEENELFPRMERAGVPRDGGPIGCMLNDHDTGRQLLRRVAANLDDAAAGTPRAVEAVRRAAGDYLTMLRHHIQKEDNVLFVIAEQLLPEEEKKSMLAAFDRVEGGENAGKHERYLALADQLENWPARSPATRRQAAVKA